MLKETRLPALLLKVTIILAVTSFAVGVSLLRGDGRSVHVQLGSARYAVPSEYRPVVGPEGLLFSIAFDDWGPLDVNRPGWDDGIHVFVGPQPASVKDLLELQFGKYSKGRYFEIERSYRVEPGFTLFEMGSGYDIVVPDQNTETLPEGFMRCDRPKLIAGYAPGCRLRFDWNEQRWEISFGRQYLREFRQLRKKTVALMDRFREEKRL